MKIEFYCINSSISCAYHIFFVKFSDNSLPQKLGTEDLFGRKLNILCVLL